MKMSRFSSSSSSSSPLLCSRKILILLAIILCVYFTLQTSKSFNDKSLPYETVKTIQPSSTAFQSLKRPLMSNSLNPKSKEKIGGLSQEFEILWGEHRGKIHENGELLTLSLDKYSGSGFQSKNEYLFGKIEIDIKLIPGDSAGTVTTFYMSSNTTNHDEIDFEFLGNVSGHPYTLHTNIYSQGKGSREQQFRLWFDPTKDFHRYSILWTPTRIIFKVDGMPIREFKNLQDYGVDYPHDQPMRIFSSLWNADDWATQGGRVHTDWSKAPFVASFREFSANACVWEFGSSSCGSNPSFENSWLMEELDSNSLEKLSWVQENYMTYNYCKDENRFQEQGLPKECTIKGIQNQ